MRIDRAKLAYYMAKKNMKVNSLVELSGLSRVTISGIRSGKSCMYETVEKIAGALDVDIFDLVEEKKQKTK
nr:MAG TPA: Cro/C1-type HTH DNA-binding domain protein [Caudoviricetes sp.]